MGNFGKKQFDLAEKTPNEKNKFEKAVDEYEEKLNNDMVNKQRKTNITKIADEFEKKIKDIDAEEKQESTETDDNPETEDTQTSDTEETQETQGDSDTEETQEDSDTQEETDTGDVDFSLPGVPVFQELKGRISKGKDLTDKQKKFISILYGDKLSDKAAESLGIKKEGSDSSGDSDSFGSNLFDTSSTNESYDRRLLSLAGIK